MKQVKKRPPSGFGIKPKVEIRKTIMAAEEKRFQILHTALSVAIIALLFVAIVLIIVTMRKVDNIPDATIKKYNQRNEITTLTTTKNGVSTTTTSTTNDSTKPERFINSFVKSGIRLPDFLHNANARSSGDSVAADAIVNMNKYLASITNLSRNPCKDFFEFACENFEKATNNANVFDMVQLNNIRQLINVFEDENGKYPDAEESKMFGATKLWLKKCAYNTSERSMGFEDLLDELKRFAKSTGIIFPLLDQQQGRRQHAPSRRMKTLESPKEIARAWGQLIGVNRPTPSLDLLGVNLGVILEKPGVPPYFVQFAQPLICAYVDVENLELKFEPMIDTYAKKMKVDAVAVKNLKEDLNSILEILVDHVCQSQEVRTYTFLTAVEANRRYPFFDFIAFIRAYALGLSANASAKLLSANYRIGLETNHMETLREALRDLGKQGFANLVFLNLIDYTNYFQDNYANTIFNRLGKHPFLKRNPYDMLSDESSDDPNRQQLIDCLKPVETTLKDFAFVTSITREERDVTHKQLHMMVKYIFAGLNSMFDQVSWLTEKTRNRARSKVAHLTVMLLYPSELEGPKALDEHFAEVLKKIEKNGKMKVWQLLKEFEAFKFRKYMDHILLAKKVANEYLMPALLTNAAYMPEFNALQIPLGIVRPPFFFPGAAPAFNFASLGAVIGHELSHAFDPYGVKFNEWGYEDEWMDEKGHQNFQKESECIIDEYNKFCFEGSCVDGEKTVNENMADNAGLHAAYRGFNHFADTVVNASGAPLGAPFENFDERKLFFLGFAQTWCGGKFNPIAFIDVHTPGYFRVPGVLRNQPAFRSAYDCSAGTKYAPNDYCEVWITPAKHK